MIKHDNDSEKDTIEDNIHNQAPDGGWGWVVCAAAFLANFIADGTMLSSGVQMLAFLEYFGESKAKTSWVSSSQLGLSMMIGPVVSYLIARYSVRSVTIAGGIIAFVGSVAGSFSPNLSVLIFTYGVICGTGICLFFISSIVAVGLYFSRKRAIATGIAMSGSGIGVIIYPYLTQALLTVYDWRNSMLIIGAICLNACVCGSLFKPLKKYKDSACACLEGNSIPDSEPDERKSIMSFDYLKVELIPSSKIFNSTSKIDEGFSFIDHNKNNGIRQFYSDIQLNSQKVSEKQKTDSNTFLSPALRNDVFYSGSIGMISTYDPDIECLHGTNLAYEDSEPSSEEERTTECHKNKKLLQSYVQLFKKPSFLLMLCCMVMWTAQGITMTYVPDMAVSKGISRYHAATLISIIGVTNTIVRILAGIIVDFCQVQSLHMYIGALCLGAVTNFAFPWCDSFAVLASCAVGFGICMGTVVCLRTILIADILGIDQLTRVFGIIAFFQGLAFTINPPIAGFLFDVTGSYTCPFVMVGGFYTMAVVLCSALLFTGGRHVIPGDTFVVVDESDTCKNYDENA